MIKEVKNEKDANRCDELLTELILDERKYNDTIDENIVITNHFNNLINNENIVLLAYYSEEEIIGYILIRRVEKNVCLLDSLYVLEQYRNQGIANKLLNAALKKCKEFNVKYVDIKVMKNNEIAMNIYKKLNFKEYEIKLRKEI